MKRIIFDTPTSVSVSFADDDGVWPLATLSMDIFGAYSEDLPENTWYLCRVLVNKDHRGKGLGSQLLEAVYELAAARRQKHPNWPPIDVIVVEPGGYDSDVERLKVFYGRAGFEDTDKGFMVKRLVDVQRSGSDRLEQETPGGRAP